jgi:hypothetical protein
LLFSTAAVARGEERGEEEEKGKRRARRSPRTTTPPPPGAARGGRRRPTPELHRAGAPIVYVDVPARPALLRLAGVSSSPHRAPTPTSPPVSTPAAAHFFPFPVAAGRADEPSVGALGTPLPFPAAVPLFLQGPVAPLLPPLPPSPLAAASCRGPGSPVLRARHGHAAALGCQASRACVRTPSPSHAVLQPCLGPSFATHARRRVRVATRPLRPSPEHLSGATHTHSHTLAFAAQDPGRHTGSRCRWRLGPTCQRGKGSDAAGPRGGGDEAPAQPEGKRGRREGPARGRKEAGHGASRAKTSRRPSCTASRAKLNRASSRPNSL